MPTVSIVIPTLNEDLADPLASLNEYLRRLPRWTFDIVIVDDSREDVRAAGRAVLEATEWPDNVSARLVEGPHLGKGAAVRRAIQSTRGDYVLLTDVDLPVPLENVERFLRLTEAGADVVIAERDLHRKFASPTRWALSRGLLVLQQSLMFHSRQFQDTQCGFKLFRGDLARTIAGQQIVDGGMYDLEYLYLSLRKKQRIEKITIMPNPERRESKINAWKCLQRDPVDMLRVKVHGARGLYR